MLHHAVAMLVLVVVAMLVPMDVAVFVVSVHLPSDALLRPSPLHDTILTVSPEAPDKGLILYIQDLELMDFGDVALDILEAAWKRVLKEDAAGVRFVSPDEYLEERVMPHFDRRNSSWKPSAIRSCGRPRPRAGAVFAA